MKWCLASWVAVRAAYWVGSYMDRVYGIRWVAVRAAYWLGRYMDRVYGIRWVGGLGW